MTALAYAHSDLPETNRHAVSATALTRTYGEGGSAVHALRGVSIEVPQGQFAAVMGPSGVTHDSRAAATADRVLLLADGRLVADLEGPTEELILNAMKDATRG